MMNRIDRLLAQSREWSHPDEVPLLRMAAVSLLALILIAMGILLCHPQSPRGAALALLIGAVAGTPFLAVGRRHARWVGNKPSA